MSADSLGMGGTMPSNAAKRNITGMTQIAPAFWSRSSLTASTMPRILSYPTKRQNGCPAGSTRT